jgi:hypothetical protein
MVLTTLMTMLCHTIKNQFVGLLVFATFMASCATATQIAENQSFQKAMNQYGM